MASQNWLVSKLDVAGHSLAKYEEIGNLEEKPARMLTALRFTLGGATPQSPIFSGGSLLRLSMDFLDD